MIRLNQVLITGVKIKRIGETNMIPNACNKKQTTNQEAMKMDDNDVCDVIEEVHRRDKFNKEYDVRLISECEYDKDTSKNEEKISGDEL